MNVGSRDGDGAAAMRYTTCRLSPIGEYMLKDLNKDIVDFVPNYDGEETEPEILGNLVSNVLINGSSGIAVRMACNFPTHKIHDIQNDICYIIEQTKKDEEIIKDEVIKRIKAPDFATGGIIVNAFELPKIYKEGKGRIKIRGKYTIEKDNTIVFTELPYGVNKLNLVNNINSLIKDVKNTKGQVIKEGILKEVKIARDESDKSGLRVVIELKKGSNVQLAINKLFKHTKLQDNFNINMTGIIGEEPQTFSLMSLLNTFLEHSVDIIIRRTNYNLKKIETRLNLVEGILKCFEPDPLDNTVELIERVIETIRNSNSPECLEPLGFNEDQAKYIWEMKLRRLSKVSQEDLIKEKKDLIADIEFNKSILNDQNVLLDVLVEEYKKIENLFGDERKTEVLDTINEIEDEDLIADETLIVTYTTEGTIKAVSESEYKLQRRGGKGSKATDVKEDENIKFMYTVSSKDDLLFFTTLGRCHILKAYKIGKSSRTAKGKNINNYLSLEPNEKIITVINTNIKKNKDKYLLMITKNGQLKKMKLSDLSSVRTITKVITFKENDKLRQSLLIGEDDFVIIVTRNGMSIKIDTSKIRAMGKVAIGVKGITLKDQEDSVIDMCLANKDYLILTITENGIGKRTNTSNFKLTNRGGKGIICHKLNDKTGKIVSALIANDDEELFVATENGLIIRTHVNQIPIVSRTSMGNKIISLKNNDKVASISKNKIQNDENDKDTE